MIFSWCKKFKCFFEVANLGHQGTHFAPFWSAVKKIVEFKSDKKNVFKSPQDFLWYFWTPITCDYHGVMCIFKCIYGIISLVVLKKITKLGIPISKRKKYIYFLERVCMLSLRPYFFLFLNLFKQIIQLCYTSFNGRNKVIIEKFLSKYLRFGLVLGQWAIL